jgi:hypothetical protein
MSWLKLDPKAGYFHMTAPAPGAQSFNDHSSNPTIHAPQNTTINVSSNGADARQIAQHVARGQSRLNADLIRNMQGAVA